MPEKRSRSRSLNSYSVNVCLAKGGKPWNGARPWISVLAAAALVVLSIPAVALDWSLAGSSKSYLSWVYNPHYNGKSAGVASDILRLTGTLYPTDWLDLELAYLLSPEIISPTLVDVTASRTTDYRFADLRRRLLPPSEEDQENIGLYHEIDRASATVHFSFGDLSVGRQAISWGSAHVVNPTDIIVPYRFLTLDTEYRQGVDAVRLRVPIAMMNELDAGYVAGKDFQFDRSAVFAGTHLYLLQTDVSILAMIFKENALGGLDIARAVGGAGVWLETAYVLPDITKAEVEQVLERDYIGISAGVDYNFTDSFYGYAEYHFNSAGKNDPRHYLDIYIFPEDHPAYSEGNVYLLGRHYLSLGGTYTVTPLLPVSALVMLNLTDFSVDLSLTAEYNFTENVYITAGFYIGIGEGPDSTGGVPTRYRSEFGAYPDVFFTAVKVYF